jgi:hypothetical protein
LFRRRSRDTSRILTRLVAIAAFASRLERRQPEVRLDVAPAS